MRKISLILLLANMVFGANVTWRGTTSQAWNDGGNWEPSAVPTTADAAIITGTPGPIVDSSTSAVSASVKVNGPLNVNGGSLATNNSWIIIAYEAGTNGTMTIEGGTVTAGTTMYVGFEGTGTLYMNSGTLNVNGSRLGIARNSAAAVGHLYLNGGTINCLDFTMATVAGSSATMNITGGKLIINGDKTTAINTFVSNGWITGYGSVSNVRYDYNVSMSGKTTVWAYNDTVLPTKATSPTPANGAVNVLTNNSLSWSSGANATSHDIYFSTTNPPTFKGNQTSTIYNPGSMNDSNVYYWRIDEKNDNGTAAGDVWSFTTAAAAGLIPKNIHLQWNEKATDATMTVMWATLSDSNSVVNYGLSSVYGLQKIGTKVYVPACGQYIHTVELAGLSPNRVYHYSCGSSAAWSDDAAFTTGMSVGDANEFVFAVGGDIRNPDESVPNPTYAGYRIAVMNTILLDQPRFFLFLGDFTNRGRYQGQWDEIFENLSPQMTTMPYMMVWGSHEDPDIYPNAFAQFDFPLNGTPVDNDKYYSFDFGNAHFTVLYVTAAAASNPLTASLLPAGSTQYNWLVNDLQEASNNPNIEWKFVSIHAPPYSTATRSGGGSCIGLRADIEPLMAQFGIDVVFTAHEHNFERTHLIKNSTIVQEVPIGSTLVNPQGTIYYVSGGAGAGLNECDGNAWFSATHQNLRHHLLMRCSGKTLNIKAIQVGGAILDEITIEHSTHIAGDLNSDGQIDTLDIGLFTNQWLVDGLWP